jgi:hypothetical protein
MAQYKNQTFKQQTLVLDGNSFEGCEFQSCTLVFNGVSEVSLTGSQIKDCRWSFDGPAARTLQFMQALYQSGGGGRDLMAETFRRFAAGASSAPAAAGTLN